MITSLELTNFKPWHRTGLIKFAPITVLFGTNSSGKSNGRSQIAEFLFGSCVSRIALAWGDEPLWPMAGSTSVDAALADDAERARWRLGWVEVLQQVGSASAGERARPAVDLLFDDPD